MSAVFKWIPVNKPTAKTAFRTLTAQFGDGYMQRTGDGINNRLQTWTLEFAGSGVEDAYAFLMARAGWQSFQWTTPRGETLYFLAGDISTTFHGNRVISFTTTFTQTFRP